MGKLDYESYQQKVYSELKEYLNDLTDEELQSFMAEQEPYIKQMYNHYLEAEGNGDDGVAYNLSLMY